MASPAATRARSTAGELEIRPDQFEAFAAGKAVGLTRREYELLSVLADAGGRVLERDDIYQRVWGYSMAHGDRSVDVFVRKLRAKLHQHSPGWEYIHTHFGVGYRFEADPGRAEDAPSGPGEAEIADAAVEAAEPSSISAST